jgi:serine protease Do
MKTKITKHPNQRMSGIVLGALLCLWLPGQSPAASPPRLNLQEKAVSPQVKAATSLAPVVKRVSPSVVNIYTTKKVKDMPRMMPFFDDPFFRQFFGDPWGGQGRVPQARREQALGSGVIVSEEVIDTSKNN